MGSYARDLLRPAAVVASAHAHALLLFASKPFPYLGPPSYGHLQLGVS